MAKEVRVLAGQYPFQIRLRARELFLRGVPTSQISELLGKEIDEAAALKAAEAGEPAPAPSVRLPLTVLRYWQEEGSWGSYRKQTERIILRDQVKRVQRDMALRVREQSERISRTQAFLDKYLTKPLLDPTTGEPMVFPAGVEPAREAKLPEDAPMDMVDVLKLQLLGVKVDMAHVEMTGKLLGDYLPKIDPAVLIGAPPPAAPLPPVVSAPVVPETPPVVEEPPAPGTLEPPVPKKTRGPKPKRRMTVRGGEE